VYCCAASSRAMAFKLVTSLARSFMMKGLNSAARWSALALRTRRLVCLPLSPLRRFCGLPSIVPRALAAASAAFVLSDIQRRPSSATTAMMPTVMRLACGMSAATKSMPAFSRPSRKWASRDKRSSLAMTNFAPQRRQAAKALASSGRSLCLPLSNAAARERVQHQPDFQAEPAVKLLPSSIVSENFCRFSGRPNSDLMPRESPFLRERAPVERVDR
jgi:hypothetical protein